MKITQHLKQAGSWREPLPSPSNEGEQLILLFGSRDNMKNEQSLEEITKAFPDALIAGCSTSGEILGTEVYDNTISLTAIKFKKTRVKGVSIEVPGSETSHHVGEKLAESLLEDDLSHVFILSDGLIVNGSELVSGITSLLPTNVSVTGGLSGDGSNFQETYVCLNGPSLRNHVAAIGFYGSDLKIGCASLGGWDPFGPERLVTRSIGNILYELDGRSALELYKEYLGEHAAGLPATGLLFPLCLRTGEKTGVVRTILGINEEEGSLTFAGDIPEGSYAQLMKANFDRLIDGAVGAARNTFSSLGSHNPELAILISCVGRKLILKQRIEEEVEGVRDVFGEKTPLTGFYSYGEISPFTPDANCELHNQTMTITTLSESD